MIIQHGCHCWMLYIIFILRKLLHSSFCFCFNNSGGSLFWLWVTAPCYGESFLALDDRLCHVQLAVWAWFPYWLSICSPIWQCFLLTAALLIISVAWWGSPLSDLRWPLCHSLQRQPWWPSFWIASPGSEALMEVDCPSIRSDWKYYRCGASLCLFHPFH